MPMSSPWPNSIREINDLPLEKKQAIYQTLIPDWVFPTFGINPQDNTVRGTPVIHKRCPAGSNAVEISIYNVPESTEPVMYLHMGDTFNSQLIVLLVIINDPASPRFNVDVDENGHPNQLGIRGRNIPEERRAMEVGLAPGQVRRGLRIFRTGAIPTFERFVTNMGHELFFVEPLFYHNAIIFEKYGFTYSRGFQKMKMIHQEFQPGRTLHAQLDNATPFRHPDARLTVTGRSWAIHDGVLGESFSGIQMYKHVGRHAGVDTFPDAQW
jgi:hypothetical protein